jgi:hypothetical protein
MTKVSKKNPAMFVRIPCVPVWSKIGGIGHTRFWGDRGGYAAKMGRLRPWVFGRALPRRWCVSTSREKGRVGSPSGPWIQARSAVGDRGSFAARMGRLRRAIPTLVFGGRCRASVMRISATAAAEKTASCLRAGASGRGLRA